MSKYRLLLVDDDKALLDGGDGLASLFRYAGFDVQTAYDGESALKRCAEERFDVAILDIHMPPGIDGFEVLRRLRANGDPSLIIIMLTDYPHGAEMALDQDADDYVKKPFEPIRLIKLVGRRLRQREQLKLGGQPPYLACDELKVDMMNFVVTRSGKPINLTDHQCKVLIKLMRKALEKTAADRIYYSDQYFEEYLPEGGIATNAFTKCISDLRRALGDIDGSLIETVRTLGYRFNGEVRLEHG
jgi:two-component system, OmpR family, response regulator